MEYDYDHFSAELLKEDASFTETGSPGTPLPEFDLATVDGGRARRADYLERHRPVLLTLASITCPMTTSAGPMLKRLFTEFGDRVDFLTVYVREAHPGDRYSQPHDFERKQRNAREYRDRDQIPWPVAVDDVAGSMHRALDLKPNAAYVMAPDGRIAQRVLWSNDARGVGRALESVLQQRPFGQREAKIAPVMRGVGSMKATLERAGPTALRDLRREAPPVYVLAQTADVFRPMPPLARTVAAAVGLLVSAAAVGLAIRAAVRPAR